MPACPRKDVVDPEQIGVYHCWNRCVRRAWLCGFDALTGVDYEYRRLWIKDRLVRLAQLYAIEISWHALMSNHIHLILRNRPDVVATWSDKEVVRRMLTIHRLTRALDGDCQPISELEIRMAMADPEQVACYRRRLADISSFMASLDEYVARRCNREDGVKGSFWEDRFGCRSLEDEAAILLCGIYIDLNPIRAGEARTPEDARHTSAWNRIQGERERATNGRCDEAAQPSHCDYQAATAATTEDDGSSSGEPAGVSVKPVSTPMPADGWLCELTLREGLDVTVADGLTSATPWRLTDKGMLPIHWEAYLALLRWTAEQKAAIRPVADEGAAIPQPLAALLEQLRIRPAAWLECVRDFEKLFGRAVGRAENLARRAARTGNRWLRGQRVCAAAFT